MGAKMARRKNEPIKTGYDKKAASKIIELLRNGVLIDDAIESVKADGFKVTRTKVTSWLYKERDFRDAYLEAKRIAMIMMADEMLSISDNSQGDAQDDGAAQGKRDNDGIARAKLMIETRKWLMSKFANELFGDKLTVEEMSPKVVVLDFTGYKDQTNVISDNSQNCNVLKLKHCSSTEDWPA